MTYYVTALTNDKARLIVSETRTTDHGIFKMVVAAVIAAGHIVEVREEA